MSLQSNTQGTVTSSNNWRYFVTDFSKDIFELEMLGGDFVRGECFCSVFQFSSEIATMPPCFVFFEEVHCFVSRWNWDGAPQILSWFMQMDLSFVEPYFHFAQIEVYESQDKRMIGKSQHGEGFQKQLGLFPRLLWVRVGTISRRSGVTSFSWSLMHHEPW